ncbi:enoyl-CoA hydratase-related protein [Candidatus Hodarchaeum mangrovi]
MQKYETIKVKISNYVAVVTLSRPEIHNAFNSLMIEELTTAFKLLENDEEVRVIVLTGKGKSFSAGADVNYMRESKEFTYEENEDDALRLEELFYTIYKTPKPVIGRINGSAFGGGIGLISVCDISLIVKNAKLAFSEVNLGILPAVISPYIISKIGFSNATRFFLTGERFDGQKALDIGLVHEIAENLEELDLKLTEIINHLFNSSPAAMKSIKEVLNQNRGSELKNIREYCIKKIAEVRTSDEGKEGLTAFVEKRSPRWKISYESNLFKDLDLDEK